MIRSLPPPAENPIPLPADSSVILETTGLSSDQDIVRLIVGGWLGEQGYRVGEEGEDAAYQIHIIVETLGTEYGETFFGMPPVQSVLIPFALPELSLYKAQHQNGYVRLYMDIYEISTDRFIRSTPPYMAETYFNDYTILFFVSFHTTNLIFSPRLGTNRESVETKDTDH